MKTQLELIRHNKAIEYLTKSLDLLNHKDRVVIESIITNCKEQINFFNNENLEVINPTKAELGSIGSSLKKIVNGVFINPINKKLIFTYKYTSQYEKHLEVDGGCECDECLKEENAMYEAKYSYYKPIKDLQLEFTNACNKTVITKDIIDAKILLARKSPNYWLGYNKLDWELSEFIKLKMLESFQEQNKSLIQKAMNFKI